MFFLKQKLSEYILLLLVTTICYMSKYKVWQEVQIPTWALRDDGRK